MTRSLLMVFLLGIALAGCGGDDATLPDVASTSGPGGSMADGGGPGATTTCTGSAGGLEVFREVPGEGDGPLSSLVIYFDFDRSEIRADFNSCLLYTSDAADE